MASNQPQPKIRDAQGFYAPAAVARAWARNELRLRAQARAEYRAWALTRGQEKLGRAGRNLGLADSQYHGPGYRE